MADKKTNVDIVLALDAKSLKRSVKTAAGSFDSLSKDIKRSMFRASKHIDSISHSLTNMGMAATAAGVVVGSAFAFIAKDSIDAASDLEETQGKFDVVFQGMTSSAEKWSTTLQDAYILTHEESKKYLASIQDLLVPTGLAREEAGKMSFEFVKLAADLASFNNLKTEDVVRDMQSALQGSSETMAKYGVNVKVAKIEQEILNQGWAKSKKDITDSMKAQALMNITLRQTTDAQGDLARTSGSYANQMRLAKKNVDDLSTAFGSGLLPAANLVVQKFNEMFSANDIQNWGVSASVSVLKFGVTFVSSLNETIKMVNELMLVLNLSLHTTLKLTNGVKYYAQTIARLQGDEEALKRLHLDRLNLQYDMQEALESAAAAQDRASTDNPALKKMEETLRVLIVSLDAENKSANSVDKLAESAAKAKIELVKVGDTWQLVNKKIVDSNEKAADNASKDWGEVWLDFQKETNTAVDQAEDDIDRLMKKIKETAGPHKITFAVQEAHQAGGQVGLGFNIGGSVPGGWGGGDRIRALLEPGEFVMRKEAVAKWGLGFMAGLNALRPDSVRMQAGGPVAAPASGVSANSTPTVRLDFGLLPGQRRVTAFADRENAREIARQWEMIAAGASS